jgi:hypothetical protein
MKIALLDARQGDRDPANSSTVAYRNMLVLKEELGADLFVSARELQKASSDYDAIICGFGSTSCERDQSVAFINRNKNAEMFWLVGEYEQSTFAPLFYSKRHYHVLKNYEHAMKGRMIHKQTFVNINALLASPAPAVATTPTHPGVYYGRWREGRAKYFSRYLVDGTLLSTSPKNMKIFASAGCKPKYARAMAWDTGRETLRLFSASLYIEDSFTHTHYNCPANRYYEAIKCGVPLLFQPEAMNTFERYGLKIDKSRIVRDGRDFAGTANEILNNNGLLASLRAEQVEWGRVAESDKSGAIMDIKRALGIAI